MLNYFDIELSPEERLIQQTVREFCDNEVMPIIRDPAGAYAYMVVSWVVNDVLTRQRVRDHKPS